MSAGGCDLSFDPRDPWFPVPGVPGAEWAVQVFTRVNGYGLHEGSTTRIETLDGYRLEARRLARLGQQALAGSADVRVEIRRQGPHVRLAMTATLDADVKSVKVRMRGLPGSDDRWRSASTADGGSAAAPLRWRYPSSDWATPWASNGRTSLSVRLPDAAAVVLDVSRQPYEAGPVAELAYAVPATTRSTTCRVPDIVLSLDERAGLDEHLAHVETTFGLVPWEKRADVPAWLRRTRLVVTLHGQHWTGHVFNDYAEMGRIVEELGRRGGTDEVLAYLPGWEGRYYYDYPWYRPADDLGGEGGFARLVERAHAAGVRVMPMFGAHGANAQLFDRWEHSALRNPTDRFPVLLNAPDWDGDRFPETDQVFLNPGAPDFRAHLVGEVSRVVGRYDVDAAFFDTAGFWFDDPRHAVLAGLQGLADDLRACHPELLLAAEGWWDGLMGVFPLSQQWLGVDRRLLDDRLPSRFIRTSQHLAEGAPGSGSTGVHEEGFRAYAPAPVVRGHLPAIAFTGDNAAAAFAAADRVLGPAR